MTPAVIPRDALDGHDGCWIMDDEENRRKPEKRRTKTSQVQEKRRREEKRKFSKIRTTEQMQTTGNQKS